MDIDAAIAVKEFGMDGAEGNSKMKDRWRGVALIADARGTEEGLPLEEQWRKSRGKKWKGKDKH
jgi:hypothetical protein